MWRDERRGVMRFTVEEGELIVKALDSAVAGGEVTTDLDPRRNQRVKRDGVVCALG